MFQKKKPIEIIPEPLTALDIKKIKDKLNEKEDSNFLIKDLTIPELIPQEFNDTVITIIDNLHHIFAAQDLTGDKFKTFKKTKGGIFNKDVLNFRRDLPHGKYVLIEGDRKRDIVRLIDDEELLLFKTLRLIHGIIKDKPYMLLKSLGKNDKLTSSRRYIKENSVHEDEVEVMNTVPLVAEVEDDHEPIISSVSLFDE